MGNLQHLRDPGSWWSGQRRLLVRESAQIAIYLLWGEPLPRSECKLGRILRKGPEVRKPPGGFTGLTGEPKTTDLVSEEFTRLKSSPGILLKGCFWDLHSDA